MNAVHLETATLGGGCFWCLEAVYQQVRGVTAVVSGYAGGTGANPTYEAVCAGVTGHAEVVAIEFNTQVVSYRDLLEIFFVIHDPTTLNQQGNDIGTQYRSVIYTNSPEQAQIAHDVVAELTRENAYGSAIVTEIQASPIFYAAEAYHQNYFQNHPAQGYCAAVIAPKLSKFRAKFKALMNTTA